jgi:tetratricopeptide (TPR) repeat protein
MARQVEKRVEECSFLCYRAWIGNLSGDTDKASADFRQAEVIQRDLYSTKHYLFTLRGILHADHLRRIGETKYARKVTKANLGFAEGYPAPADLSCTHRVLGDLDADDEKHSNAHEHYDEALRIAQGIQNRKVLIEALLARGRWYGKHKHDAKAAFSDLNEALDYAVDGGYRIYEADIRIGLAWAHAADDNIKSASEQAQRALQMSEEMGYHWGKMDAKEVLEKIKKAK